MDYLNNQMKHGGFNPDNYSENQKNIMTEPSNGPENFYMDGEVTHTQALKYWKDRMSKNGISETDIRKATKMNFG